MECIKLSDCKRGDIVIHYSSLDEDNRFEKVYYYFIQPYYKNFKMNCTVFDSVGKYSDDDNYRRWFLVTDIFRNI